MLFLADCNRSEWENIGKELGMEIGQLITPLTGRSNMGSQFAIDNGAFAGFDGKEFYRILERERENKNRCLWVAVHDVVGSAVRTREVFDVVAPRLENWPLAYVCQDGQGTVGIPWKRVAAIFIGGTDNFKCSAESEACIKAAKILGRWVHVGRVNTAERMEWCEKLGVDSVDGTGVSRYSHMREKITAAKRQEKLF